MQDELFTVNPALEESSSGEQAPVDPMDPLAVRMRPRSLDEVVGQDHLLGPGAPLRRLVEGATAAINAVVEGWIREYPGQWLWMHRRWR